MYHTGISVPRSYRGRARTGVIFICRPPRSHQRVQALLERPRPGVGAEEAQPCRLVMLRLRGVASRCAEGGLLERGSRGLEHLTLSDFNLFSRPFWLVFLVGRNDWSFRFWLFFGQSFRLVFSVGRLDWPFCLAILVSRLGWPRPVRVIIARPGAGASAGVA